MQVKFNPISATVGKRGYKVNSSTFKIKLKRGARIMLNIKARNKFIDAKNKGILDAEETMEYIEECLHNQPEVIFMSKHGAVTFTSEDLE